MLRHKAAIQCARVAFSLSGIYEPDEAERIEESSKEPVVSVKNATQGDPSHPEFEALVTMLELEAQKGETHLGEFWKNTLTKEQRQIIGANELARVKEMAKQYEKGNLQEAEYTEA